MMKNGIGGAWGDISSFGRLRSTRRWNGHGLPHLTALSSTLVQMELLLDCPVVDLYALAGVVQQDVGFASQLLQLVNADRHPHDRILRIEDCLIDLGIQWLLAIVRELPMSTHERD